MKSIFARTYAILLLLMVVGFIVSLILFDNLLERSDGAVFEREALAEASMLEAEILKQPPSRWQDVADNYSPVFDTEVSIIDRAEVEASEYAAMVNADRDTIIAGVSFEEWWLLRPLPDGERYVLVEEHEVSLAEVPADDWIQLFAPLVTIAMIVAGALWFISRNIAKPINELSTVAQALGEGRLDARADPNTVAPMDALALRFNEMAGDIQSLVDDQGVIIGALPHELRTPIARVRFALDMTRHLDSLDDLRAQLEQVDDYLMSLETVVEDTLALSQVTIGETYPLSRILLWEIVEKLCQGRYADCEKDLEWSCAVEGQVVGSPELLTLVFSNLLENAIRHAKSRVIVSAAEECDGWIVVAVDDDGLGIPESERENVFRPFYRPDSSRSRATGGLGLGLAIVNMIARQMQGATTVTASTLGGARVEFRWPETPVVADLDVCAEAATAYER